MNPRQLDLEAVVATAVTLHARIADRFAGRGIAGVAAELEQIAKEASATVERLERPHWPLRMAVGAVLVVAAVLAILSASTVRIDAEVDGLSEFLQVIESGVQNLVYLGLAVLFLLSLEHRRRRRRVLAAIHELRSLCHVIDMHQLTKDPDSLSADAVATANSPHRSMTRYETARYLDYCSEMLSLTAKVAATYVQRSSDSVVLASVREIQELASDLSSELWQKIVLIDAMSDEPVPGPLRRVSAAASRDGG